MYLAQQGNTRSDVPPTNSVCVAVLTTCLSHCCHVCSVLLAWRASGSLKNERCMAFFSSRMQQAVLQPKSSHASKDRVELTTRVSTSVPQCSEEGVAHPSPAIVSQYQTVKDWTHTVRVQFVVATGSMHSGALPWCWQHDARAQHPDHGNSRLRKVDSRCE